MNFAIYLLPICAAMFYGMGFALMDRALQATNVVTYMILGAIISFPLVGVLAYAKREKVSFEFINNWQDIVLVIAAVLAPALGWFLTAYTIKNIGGAYAAFAEVSYPLFTVLFLFAFFGIKNFDWHLFLGGGLIIAGSFILVLGQFTDKSP